MIRTLAIIALLLTAGAASAQPYILGTVGVARASGGDVDNTATANASGLTVRSVNDSNSNEFWALGAGYRFAKNAAAEVSMLNLGNVRSINETFRSASTNDFMSTRNDWRARGLGLSALGFWPLSQRVALLVKLSLYRLKGEFSGSNTRGIFLNPASNVTTNRSSSGSGTAPGIGAGVSIALSSNLSGRAMLEAIRPNSGTFGGGNDLGTIMLINVSLGYAL